MTGQAFFAENAAFSEFYLWREGRLIAALIEPIGGWSEIGALYGGRVLRIEPALDAAFVDIGQARPGLLPLKKRHAVTEGQALIVEIRRDGWAEKGAKLSAHKPDPVLAELARRSSPPCRLQPAPTLWQQHLAGLPQEAVATIFCAYPKDAKRLAAALPDCADRVAISPERDWRPDRAALEEAMAAALEKDVALPGGGLLTFEPTQSLIAIDVDSGKAKAGRSLGQTAFAVDLAAAAEIPRQLALRNLGGIIVVDFIDIDHPEKRRAIVAALREAAAFDPLVDWIGPMSRLGLVEMRRRRRGPSLAEMCAWRAKARAQP